jgi:hemolysin activation/secretion protein
MHNSDFHTGIDTFRGKEKFFKYTGNIIRLQKLGKGTLLILKAATQIADDALPSAEQFTIGGAYSVRGYPEGLLCGDNGYLFSSELRFPIMLLPKEIWNLKLRENIQGVLFAETAGAFEVGHINVSQTLSSVGVGVRARLTKYLSGRVDYGFGLVNRESNQPAARLHFGVESNPF